MILYACSALERLLQEQYWEPQIEGSLTAMRTSDGVRSGRRVLKRWERLAGDGQHNGAG